jgi:hypothetical protein
MNFADALAMADHIAAQAARIAELEREIAALNVERDSAIEAMHDQLKRGDEITARALAAEQALESAAKIVDAARSEPCDLRSIAHEIRALAQPKVTP